MFKKYNYFLLKYCDLKYIIILEGKRDFIQEFHKKNIYINASPCFILLTNPENHFAAAMADS